MTSPWPAPDPSTMGASPSPPPAPFLTPPRAIAIVAGALVLILGAIGFAALGDGEQERPDAAVASTDVEPEETAAPDTEPATAPSAAATTDPATSAPVETTAPATSTAASTSAAPAPTAAPPPPAPAPVATPGPATGEQRAIALAQELGDALAAGRWDAARALNPGRDESDAFLQQEYGPLVRTTIVPATVRPVGGERFDLRLGLVAHEEQPTGRQSVLMCAHWNVNLAANTVTRLSFARLRVEPGFVDPASRAAELRTTCAA